MNIVITKFKDHCHLKISHANGIVAHARTFNTMEEARSFMAGWRVAIQVANGLIQNMTDTYDLIDNS